MTSVLERPPGVESIGDKCPGPILREHLKLGNNRKIYHEILEKLRTKCQKYMAVDQRSALQEHALERIKGELQTELPDLFADDDEAIYLALRTAMKYHSNRRSQERERVAKLAKQRKSQRPGNGKEKQKTQAKAPPIDEEDEEDENIPPASSAKKLSSASLLRSGRARLDSSQSSGATSSQPSSASLSTQSSNIFTSRISQARVSAFASDDTGELGNESVYAFLANSVPSMAHLYPLFMNFGCNSEEYLLGVSTWDAEAIESFLRRVASQAPLVDDDIQMGEMDLLILQNHFRRYFNV